MADPSAQIRKKMSPSRILGQVVLGLLIGFALLPALLELAALANEVTAFKYQGF